MQTSEKKDMLSHCLLRPLHQPLDLSIRPYCGHRSWTEACTGHLWPVLMHPCTTNPVHLVHPDTECQEHYQAVSCFLIAPWRRFGREWVPMSVCQRGGQTSRPLCTAEAIPTVLWVYVSVVMDQLLVPWLYLDIYRLILQGRKLNNVKRARYTTLVG